MGLKDVTEEMQLLIASSPKETFKLFRGVGAGAENNFTGFVKNWKTLKVRTGRAYAEGFYMEVISLSLQYIDYWLRLYFLDKAKGQDRPKEFGRLLKACKPLGLRGKLYDRLHRFNKERVKAIHGYVVGAIVYDELKDVAEESGILGQWTYLFVVSNAGEVITQLPERLDDGDIIITPDSKTDPLLSSLRAP